LNRKVVQDFEHYAVTCFTLFGDRVSSWITFNEPHVFAVMGYVTGLNAPGRSGAPERDPYVVGHNVILAHAYAARQYQSNFQRRQRGQIGISLDVDWREPCSKSTWDKEAAQRALDWDVGWFADPIWKGDYPSSMRLTCGERLPVFTIDEKELIKDTADFFGLNHFSTAYAAAPSAGMSWCEPGFFQDEGVMLFEDERWVRTDMQWAVVPWGLRRVCEYLHDTYHPRNGIIVTENGCAVHEDSAAEAKQDLFRVAFLQSSLLQVHKAIQNGADVRGYFVWSLLDTFEWQCGYAKRFGLVRVDYATQERTVKLSGKVFAEIAKANTLSLPRRFVNIQARL